MGPKLLSGLYTCIYSKANHVFYILYIQKYIWIAEVYLKISHASSNMAQLHIGVMAFTSRRTPLTGAGSTASLGGNRFDLGLTMAAP
jgi:hypothetical protein